MSTRRDICAPTNCTFAEAWAFTAGGFALDLTGWSGEMQIRPYPGGALLLSLTTGAFTMNGSGLAIVNGPDGILDVVIAVADLQALPGGVPGLAVYDLLLTDQTSFVQRFVGGQFITFPGVSQ